VPAARHCLLRRARAESGDSFNPPSQGERLMSRPKISLLAFVLLASIAAAAQAGGAYSQNFSAAVSDWAVANDTWAVTAGDYRNQNGVLPTPISWYTGNTWTTNFKYKVRAYSEWPGTGNQVGLIFGVNSTGTQYFQVLVNMAGTVTLERVSGSTVTSISGAGQPQTGFGLAADTWFDLEVFVNQSADPLHLSESDVTVRVNGKLAIVRAGITHVTGRIGVITRADLGRFDDVSVIDNGSAKQLFRGTFSQPTGQPVTITAPDCNPLNGGELVCYSDITEHDASGYQWPAKVWGGSGRFQYITRNPAPVDPDDPTENVDVEIAHVPGWTGNNSDVLHQIRVHRYEYPPPDQAQTGNPQIPYIIRPPGTQSETPLYLRFRWKFDGNFGTWHMPFQFKTGDDSYRVSLFVETSTPNTTSDPEGAEPCTRSTGDHTPRFVLRADESDSVPIYWQTCVNDIAVPANTWMKIEIYFDRVSGRVWLAIDGVRKIDRTIAGGLRLNGNPDPINRIMFPQSYGGYVWPAEQWVDDMEIWTGFPADASTPH
jgi:hypothetical protein